jgi:hypothetical protein
LSTKGLSSKQRLAVLTALSTRSRASFTALKSLIRKRKAPAGLKWQPDLCINCGNKHVLIHALVAPEFPSYLETALKQLEGQRYRNTSVLLLAREISSEAGDDLPPARIAAPIVALKVADRALSSGCALAFELEGKVHTVFHKGYRPPPPCVCGEETGHIPKWLYRSLANAPAFSPHLSRAFKAFGKQYERQEQNRSRTIEKLT